MARKRQRAPSVQWVVPLDTFFDMRDWSSSVVAVKLKEALEYLEFLEDCNKRLKEIVG